MALTSHPHHHRLKVKLNDFSPPSELITAESIYPCLDHFAILLKQKENVKLDNPHHHHHHHKTVSESTQNNTRQLIRVYWATEDIVDSIARAHSRVRYGYRQHGHHILSHPHPPHSQHPNSHHHHHHHHHQHQPHFFPSTRPSKLIELRLLNYVREYSLTDSNELLRITCDIFEPKESIFYCFVYIMLHHSTVLYENVPHCVPTTIDFSRKISKAIRQLPDTNHSEPMADNQSAGDSFNDSVRRYSGKNSENQLNKQSSLTDTNRIEQTSNRQGISPPGPAYDLVTKQHGDDDVEEAKNIAVSYDYDNTRDLNIKQFALKSTDQSDYETESKRVKQMRRRKVMIQTRSCLCSSSVILSDKLTKENVVKINLTSSETIVLHLIITSCPINEWSDIYKIGDVKVPETGADSASDGDDGHPIGNYSVGGDVLAYGPDDLHLDTDSVRPNSESESFPNSSDNATSNGISSGASVAVQSDKSNAGRKHNRKHHHHHHQEHSKKRKKKGKKRKKFDEDKRESIDWEPSSKESDWPTSSITSSSPSTPVSSTSTTMSNGVSSSTTQFGPISLTTEPTLPNPSVCILTIDNPREYSLKLDSIEPSYDFQFEPPVNSGQFPAVIDLIDYLDKFPFLVIRNGQFSIDPQMNIENRSQTHFLRSSYLRFEALSSINVTLRFRRSAPFVNQSLRAKRLDNKQLDDDRQQNETQVSMSSTLVTLIQQIVSYLALKFVNIGDAQVVNRRREELWFDTLSPFHITSIILSLFMALTLIIYALIAVHGCQVRRQNLQPQTNDETNITCVPSTEQNSSVRCKQKDTASNSISLEQQSMELDYYDYAQPLMVHTASVGSLKAQTVTDNQFTGEQRVPVDTQYFSTLPIKLNCSNRIKQDTCFVANSSTTATNAQSTLNKSNSTISTLTRLSFTKPPILLSTFTRTE